MSICTLQFVFTVVTRLNLLTAALVGRKSHMNDPVPEGCVCCFFSFRQFFVSQLCFWLLDCGEWKRTAVAKGA